MNTPPPWRPSPGARTPRVSPRASAASPAALRAITADLARRAAVRPTPSDDGGDGGVELEALAAVLAALHAIGEAGREGGWVRAPRAEAKRVPTNAARVEGGGV